MYLMMLCLGLPKLEIIILNTTSLKEHLIKSFAQHYAFCWAKMPYFSNKNLLNAPQQDVPGRAAAEPRQVDRYLASRLPPAETAASVLLCNEV